MVSIKVSRIIYYVFDYPTMFASHFKLLCHLDSPICATMFLLFNGIPIYDGKNHPNNCWYCVGMT